MKLDIQILKNNMLAKIIYLPPPTLNSAPLTELELYAELKKKGIKSGVKTLLINEALRLHNTGKPVRNLELAEGINPQDGEDGRVVFHFEKTENPSKHIESENLSLETLQKYFVVPGQLIGVIIPPTEGLDGSDIFGKIVKGNKGKEAYVQLGKNVIKNGNKIIADTIGLVEINDNRILLEPLFNISPDKMKATITLLPSKDSVSPLKLEYILKLFSDNKITFGIKGDVINLEYQNVIKKKVVKPNIVVAEGENATDGTDASLDAEFNTKLTDFDVAKLGDIEYINEIAHNFFSAGCMIANYKPATSGKPGRNIFGKEIKAKLGKNAIFRAGKYVLKIEHSFKSKTFGFASLKNNILDIKPFVRISKNRMAAYLPFFPPVNDNLPRTIEQIKESLTADGVLHGINEDAIGKSFHDVLNKNEVLLDVLVAEGTPPQDGHKEKIEPLIDLTVKVGTLNESGKLDFKEQDFARNIKRDHEIAIKIPMQRPIDGTDVNGKLIKAAWKSDTGYKIGLNIEEDPENKNMYKSSIEGMIVVAGNQINITDVLSIPGSINYKTGNIKAKGSVKVGGEVNPGFSIQAEGDIIIDKVVDSATIDAGGDIVVREGVWGKSGCNLTAGRTIKAGFISDTKVITGGDLIVGDAITNSYVNSKGKVIVASKHGCIMGGEVFAQRGIEVRVIGSKLGIKSKVGIKLAEIIEKQIKDVSSLLGKIEGYIKQIHKILGPDLLKNPRGILQVKNPQKRAEMLKALQKLSELLRQRDIYKQKLKQVKEENKESLYARIKVFNKVFTGTQIQFNDKIFLVEKDMVAVTFYFDLEEGKIKYI